MSVEYIFSIAGFFAVAHIYIYRIIYIYILQFVVGYVAFLLMIRPRQIVARQE